MAVKKIEFEDKVSTIESSLPAINRIRDVDINEIKSVVNNNADELTSILDNEVYSTIERLTNKVWIDGKPIYRKVINVGALPNNTSKTINIGVSNLDYIVNYHGISYSPSTGYFAVLPYPHATASNVINMYFDKNNSVIGIETHSDRTSYTQTYIVIEYTKTE